MNLMYKGIEIDIDEDDQTLKHLNKRFGFKCQYVRDPKNIKYLLEVFVPIVRMKGEWKVKRMKKKHKRKD